MAELAGGDAQFLTDTGDPMPAVSAALAAFAAGTGSEQAALTALSGSRLLVPVVAVPDGDVAAASGPHSAGRNGGEKNSEMATPAIVGRDGRRALPAFTCLQALLRWQADARPVPVPAASVWKSAVAGSEAVIIDIAGPVPLAVEGARLAALAAGSPVPPLHQDPDVHAAVAAAAAAAPPGLRVRLGPAQGSEDFTLEICPAGSVAERLAADIAGRLAGRVSGGIAVVLRPAGAGR